jgi:hypothetical protein
VRIKREDHRRSTRGGSSGPKPLDESRVTVMHAVKIPNRHSAALIGLR